MILSWHIVQDNLDTKFEDVNSSILDAGYGLLQECTTEFFLLVQNIVYNVLFS